MLSVALTFCNSCIGQGFNFPIILLWGYQKYMVNWEGKEKKNCENISCTDVVRAATSIQITKLRGKKEFVPL